MLALQRMGHEIVPLDTNPYATKNRVLGKLAFLLAAGPNVQRLNRDILRLAAAAQARSPLGGQGAPAPARHRPPLPRPGNPDRLLHDRQRIRPAPRLRPAPVQEVHPLFRSPLHPARRQRGRPQAARRARRHQDPDRLRSRSRTFLHRMAGRTPTATATSRLSARPTMTAPSSSAGSPRPASPSSSPAPNGPGKKLSLPPTSPGSSAKAS